MEISIIGTRGIPASYGGFETFAEEISRNIVSIKKEIKTKYSWEQSASILHNKVTEK